MKNMIEVLGFAIPRQQFFKCQQVPIEKTTIKFQVSIGQGSKSSLFYIFVWQGLMDFFEKSLNPSHDLFVSSVGRIHKERGPPIGGWWWGKGGGGGVREEVVG